MVQLIVEQRAMTTQTGENFNSSMVQLIEELLFDYRFETQIFQFLYGTINSLKSY